MKSPARSADFTQPLQERSGLAASAVAAASWISSLVVRTRARSMAALARYLAQPVKQCAPPSTGDIDVLGAILRPGDVLLTDGNSRMAALVRRVTRSTWSHVSMYVGPLEHSADPRCIVEADVAAGVRAVRLSELRGLRVRVLRPTGLVDADRRRLADWVVSRIGDEYDMAHAWALGRRLLRLPLAWNTAPAPRSLAQGAMQFICSTLLAQAFVVVGYPIAPAQVGIRDAWAADHRYVTPRDFERAHGFEVVRASGCDSIATQM